MYQDRSNNTAPIVRHTINHPLAHSQEQFKHKWTKAIISCDFNTVSKTATTSSVAHPLSIQMTIACYSIIIKKMEYNLKAAYIFSHGFKATFKTVSGKVLPHDVYVKD